MRQNIELDGSNKIHRIGKAFFFLVRSCATARVISGFAPVGAFDRFRAFNRKFSEFQDLGITKIDSPLLLDEEPKASK